MMQDASPMQKTCLIQKAIKIADDDSMVRCLTKTRYVISSQTTKGRSYIVDITESGVKCDCPYGQKRGICKHGKAVEMILLRRMQKQDVQKQDVPKPVVLREEPLHCPGCKGRNIRKDGKRPRKYRDMAQRHKCRDCKTRFSDEPGFTGRHYGPDIILFSLLVFSMGMSAPQISLIIRQDKGLNVCHSTIQSWAEHYCVLVDKYTRNLSINAGFRWSTDEKFLKILGKDHWLFTVMDSGTRFVMSWDVSPHKFGYDARRLFGDALDRAGHMPAILVSDGLQQFKKAFRKVFYKKSSPQPVHFAESHIRNQFSNNNGHERFNGTITDHLSGVRRMGRTESAHTRAYMIHYNFVRPHKGLGGITPARAAGICIDGISIWRTLVCNAALAAT